MSKKSTNRLGKELTRQGLRTLRRKPLAGLIILIAALAVYYIQDIIEERSPSPSSTQTSTVGQKRGEIVTGWVQSVHDGDSFTLLDSSGQTVKVRLYGVDAPELKQSYGRESGDYLRNLLNGREVKIVSQGRDQYQRLLGLIYFPNDYSVTHELVAAGQVWVYTGYCKLDYCRELELAEQEARRARKGLWREKNPTPPWQYRRQG